MVSCLCASAYLQKCYLGFKRQEWNSNVSDCCSAQWLKQALVSRRCWLKSFFWTLLVGDSIPFKCSGVTAVLYYTSSFFHLLSEATPLLNQMCFQMLYFHTGIESTVTSVFKKMLAIICFLLQPWIETQHLHANLDIIPPIPSLSANKYIMLIIKC